VCTGSGRRGGARALAPLAREEFISKKLSPKLAQQLKVPSTPALQFLSPALAQPSCCISAQSCRLSVFLCSKREC
jgi:hypothetical protein